MIRLTCIAVLFFAPAFLFGQVQTQSTIEQGTAKITTKEVISYQDKTIGEKELQTAERPIVIVKTEAPKPLVRAYPSDQPFPPIRLSKFGDGEFILYGKPGSEGTIEIISQTETDWWSEYLAYRIGEGDLPPPVDPDDPQQPTDPTDDYEYLTDFVSSHEIPKADPDTAKLLHDAFEAIISEVHNASDLETCKNIVGKARGEALNSRSDFDTNWNPFLVELDSQFNENPPDSPAEYAAMIAAIVKGFEQ